MQCWLATWIAHHDEVNAESVPAYVQRELSAYLECGILAHGFARARCPDCTAEFLVAYAFGTATPRRRNDPLAPVHGPFSADFRLVYLDGEDIAPIRCSKAQVDVFRALWEFESKDRRAEDVMQRAGRRSSKPIDVFKNGVDAMRAYKALVVTNQKEGLYRMACASR